MARKLIVEIVGDSRSYERALKRSSTATNQFGQAMGATNPKLTKLNTLSMAAGGGMLYAGGAAAGLAVAIGAKSVSAASDLNEQLSRTEVVLGESADGMIDWSETTATSMGISQRAALAAAGTFAGLFQTVGVQQQQAADLSKTLVQLAADMASLANTSPEEALIALRSGLAGEAEPLRRYNIFLTEARVAQQALTETGKDNVRQLTQQEKTLARYTLIMKDSVLAQGNFELTSGGLANQQRILAAQVDNLSTKLGAVLVPAVTAVVGALNDAIQVGEDFAGVVEALANLPGIEIPVKFVSETVGGGGFARFVRYRLLGNISPLALGITIGKDLAAGIQQGVEANLGLPEGVQPGVGGAQRAAARGQRAAAELAESATKQGQAIIDKIERQATAQKSLNQQISESETREAHLKDLIRADPGNVQLQKRLTAEYTKQNSLRTEQVALGKQNAASARASAAAAKAEAEAIAEARRERERAAREALAAAIKAQQFKDIGLTAEGLEPTPSAGSLLKRALGLQGRDLEPETRKRLDRYIAFLRTHLKTAKKDVRAFILDFLNGISDAFNEGAKQGPLTKGAGLSMKVLEGIGLSPEEERELRRRLSSVSSAGRVLAKPGGGTATTAARAGGRPGEPPHGIMVESHTTINLDGQQIANVVTKNQQKSGRRNPRQKRGPQARIGGI